MNHSEPLQTVAQAMLRAASKRDVPKYIALHRAIMSAIEQGLWRASERLPPETAFAREMPVSLGTVQRALQKLADDGIVVRRHRHGTFVVGELSPEEEIRHFRFLSDDGKTLLPIYSKVFDVRRVAEGPWTAFLGDDPEFIQVRRVINVNFEFNTYSEYILPADRFRAFLDIPIGDLNNVALKHVLGVRFAAPTIRTERRLQVLRIPPEACRTIGVRARTMGMKWEVRGYGFADAPLFYQHVFVPMTDRMLEIRDRR